MPRRSNPSSPATLFGRRVRDRRLDLGISQEALAEAAGLHRTYVGSVERGERNIALINILRLADALDLDAAELVIGLKP
ncbi:MAG TPA: helix-turn-helix transcriptional regulator [Acidimicrobiales bacterium]|nr:helix-turn-helix transcriptional regulator [Acidimicrobiales bacterium]